jgi:hypothetical protein
MFTAIQMHVETLSGPRFLRNLSLLLKALSLPSINCTNSIFRIHIPGENQPWRNPRYLVRVLIHYLRIHSATVCPLHSGPVAKYCDNTSTSKSIAIASHPLLDNRHPSRHLHHVFIAPRQAKALLFQRPVPSPPSTSCTLSMVSSSPVNG